MVWRFGTAKKAAASPASPRSEVLLLHPADDRAFLWLLRPRGSAPRPGLTLAPGGLETPRTLRMLRALAAKTRDARCPAAWLMIAGSEVVGLMSFKHAPKQTGEVEIGYGVAASRRGLGYASEALTLLIQEASQDGRISALWAETHIANAASQRALQANGFEAQGLRYDPEHGPVRRWRRALSPPPPAVL